MGLPIVGLVIVGCICAVGWLAAREWRRRKEAPYAKVVAVAGFLTVSVFLVLFVLSMDKVFRSARMAMERTACSANLNRIGRAMLMYLVDNSDRGPLKNWNAALSRYVDYQYLGCPLVARYGYTMSEHVIGAEAKTFISPARTVSTFDGSGGMDSVGTESSIAYRHHGGAVFLYLDGHSKFEMPYSFKGLKVTEGG